MTRQHEIHQARTADSASRLAARVFTVPPGHAFLDALARAVLEGNLPNPGGPRPDPLTLPRYTLLLPTRRAARALPEAFLRVSGAKAMLLPRIRPIAEGDEDLSLLEGAAGSSPSPNEPDDIPPAIGELERRLLLTRLVMAWSQAQRGDPARAAEGLDPVRGTGARTPAQAVRLAAELARLVDAVETENASLARLETLVPDAFSEHWQKTLDFLRIVTAVLPAHLSERGLVSPMDRRNRVILAEARRLAATPPAHPIIVAGVTGSIPATAELMRAVMSLDNGAIVLPAVDRSLDRATWDALDSRGASHPQFGLRKLLDRLGVPREGVAPLIGADISPERAVRNTIVSEAMRPPESTMQWRTFAARCPCAEIGRAFASVSLIEAESAQDEAEAIALILREAAETPGRTAALVSPDRLLARRVATSLARWGIQIDDSAGRPFAKTVPGTFLDLVAGAAGADFAPAALMALLKHPLTRLGLPVGRVRRAARVLEIAAFRTCYLGSGLASVEEALERAATDAAGGQRRQPAARRLWASDWTAARDLVPRLRAAMGAFADLFSSRKPVPFATLAAAHVAAAEALAQPAEAGDGSPLWQGEAGEAAARLFAALIDEALPAPQIDPADYPDFYASLIVGENVRPRVPVHPRLHIWGPFEARLQQTDIVVLGSLNEGTWPAPAEPGAWLNRPMREALGLPSPEEQIGRAAHDFATLLGADSVVLTRAKKVDGAPTVPSRWLMRLQALLRGMAAEDVLEADKPWLGWARRRNHIPRRRSVSAPEPRPPVPLRPRRMSVSGVETWVSNPYAIFARYVLGLEPLPQLGLEPGPQEKGQIVHEALSRFAARYPDRLPDDVKGALLAAAKEVLTELSRHPRVAAFWLPRLDRFAEWFAATEAGRRAGVLRSLAEVEGACVFDGPAGPFTLRARADRLDVTPGGLVITDYKTGGMPNDTAVRSGRAPQLPLEAAIAASGQFTGIAASPVVGLRYIRATGAEPPGEERTLTGDADALGAAALAGLKRLVSSFDAAITPYRALRRSRFDYRYDDYAHLARVAEWSGESDEETE